MELRMTERHTGLPHSLECLLAALPKPSTFHAKIIPFIHDSALGQVVSGPVEHFRREEPGSLPSPPAREQQMRDLNPGPGPPLHQPWSPGTKRVISN